MTPKQYAEKFWRLPVYLGSPKGTSYPEVVVHPAATLYFAERSLSGMSEGLADAVDSLISEDHGIWKATRVASYRLGNSGEDKNGDGKIDYKKIDGKGDLLYKDKINSAMRGKANITVRVKRIDGVYESKTFDDYSQISYACVVPFCGKGFPEEVQVSLQLRFRYQKSPFSLDQFTSKSFIGLDCNGFVGGYLRRRNSPSEWYRTKDGWGPSTTIRELVGPPSNFVMSVDQLKPGPQMYVLGMCNEAGVVADNDGKGGFGHIMITEPNTLTRQGSAVSFEVLESTGGVGLVASQYDVLKMPRPGVFLVARNLPKGRSNMYVRIRPVD